jgi:hypothetical protein
MNRIDSSRTIKTFQIQIQTEAIQLLITIKPRYWPLGFTISTLMSTLTIKSTKFEFWIQDSWSTTRSPKSQQKAQEVHLEEGKTTKPTNGMKSGKPKKKARKS